MLNGANSSRERGVDPSEVIRDRTLVCREGPSDPPGESANNAPVVCLDIVPHDADGSVYGRGYNSRGSGANNRFRKVKWVDPKTVNDEQVGIELTMTMVLPNKNGRQWKDRDVERQ